MNPLVVLVGEPYGARRMYRLSGMHREDFADAFVLRLPGEALPPALPVVILGAKAASASEHDLPPFEWSSTWPPVVRVPEPGITGKHLNPERIKTTLREALYRSAWPAFDVVAGDLVLPCGVRVEAHPNHPNHPHLRIACVSDESLVSRRVVMPWGRSL